MVISVLDPANSVLFLGSGFSAGASNIADEKLPTGNSLLKILAEDLGEDPLELDLKSAADEYADRHDVSIYDIMTKYFTVKDALDYQKDIISLPWSRIYTTNYDDIINFVKGPSFPIFTFDEDRPSRLPPQFAVHLHGSIRKVKEDNCAEKLILNSHSYDVISRNYPYWFDEFKQNRRSFNACYFMGFSLSDHHIAGLMTAGEESVRKTYFITREKVNAAFERRAQEYGKIVKIGFEKFAELSKTLPKPEKPINLDQLTSFKYLRPGLDSKKLADPTPVEVIDLMSFGKFNQSRFFNTINSDKYVASRSSSVNEVLTSLNDFKTVLIHSGLGNGKSIFTSILALKASFDGYTVLIWRRAGRCLAQDLEFISTYKRLLIIFDDYDAAIENIQRVSSGLPDAKFVVTSRTSQQEVRYHEIIKNIPAKIKRINLNLITDDDKNQLLSNLKRVGAQVDYIEDTIKSSQDIRDIVTKLYNHHEIGEKINSLVRKLPSSLYKIIIYSSLIKWTGVEVEDDLLQDLVGSDVYMELKSADGIASDILYIHDDKIEMRSAFLAEYLVQRIINSKDILDSCYDITTMATRKSNRRAYRRLAGELIKFSTIQRFLKFNDQAKAEIERYYIRLSNDVAVNNEPLFWLQYSIFMKTYGDISKAIMFLKAGYERASNRDGFKTFQLDTQALSIYLMSEIESQSPTVEGLENIISAIETVTDMISDQSQRYYALEVLGEIPGFVNKRSANLTDSEKIPLIYQLKRTSKVLEQFNIDEKLITGSELIRKSIEDSILILNIK